MIDAPDQNQELRLHPGWWARLEGETLDLEALARTLGDRSRVQVCQLDGRYYMQMAEFDQLNESCDVETRAGEVLRIVNGAARVEYGCNPRRDPATLPNRGTGGAREPPQCAPVKRL